MSRVRRIIKRIVAGAGVALVVVYAADYAYFRLRSWHPKPADPLETLTIPRLFAIAEKGGKVDYQIDALNPEQTFTCVHSWFPHAGYSPCWYIKPKSQRPIPM